MAYGHARSYDTRMLVARDLARNFEDPSRGTVEAVQQVSLQVNAGEIYGLLGPNGAGKTTTLRILATLLQPDRGEVRIDGVDALADPVLARSRMAYVPAEAGLPEQLTATETVSLFARIQGVGDPDRRSWELIDELGVTPYAESTCSSLSTGMKRRVVLARALVHDPPVLLLDEPTDGLDVGGRRDVLELVRRLARKGHAVLVCSHIMGEMESLCDRIGIMARGRVVTEGTIPEVCAGAGTSDLSEAFLRLVEGGVDDGPTRESAV
jgi:sodium transport system ATP-binding protein